MTRPRLVVALDTPDADGARRAAHALRGHADVLKVGLELFTAQGPGLVRELVADGWGVFLDLKVHDIPATAARTVHAAAKLGVELLTVHASGGAVMLAAAADAARAHGRPRLLAVTVLTSLDAAALAEVGWPGEPADSVARLCRLAAASGCDGVVASVHEAAAVKELCGPEFLVVTPGIRPAGAGADDQARVASPADAVRAGSDYLVVGRPILTADDPAAAADAIRAEMESVLATR